MEMKAVPLGQPNKRKIGNDLPTVALPSLNEDAPDGLTDERPAFRGAMDDLDVPPTMVSSEAEPAGMVDEVNDDDDDCT